MGRIEHEISVIRSGGKTIPVFILKMKDKYKSCIHNLPKYKSISFKEYIKYKKKRYFLCRLAHFISYHWIIIGTFMCLSV